MQAIKLIKTVKHGKASIDIPKEFGDEVEIIILPLENDKNKKKLPGKKKLLDMITKAKISPDILMELENGREEDRF